MRRLGEQLSKVGDAARREAIAGMVLVIQEDLGNFLAGHVRTGHAIEVSIVEAKGGGLEVRMPDYLRYVEGYRYRGRIPADVAIRLGQVARAAVAKELGSI